MVGGSRRVLVVDDDEAIRVLLSDALVDEGYEVRAVSDGAEALEALAEWTADVVLLDLMMPGMDAWAFRERQLAAPELRDIPVVLVSAGRCLPEAQGELGSAAVVGKPFELDTLFAALGRASS